MADNENFEDDLFADLYDDNDAAAATAPVPAPAQAPAAAPALKEAAPDVAVSAGQADNVQYDQYAPTGDDNAHVGDYNENEEPYDDDDDVDFNLGNGSSVAHNVAPRHDDEIAMPTFHSKGSSTKGEDG